MEHSTFHESYLSFTCDTTASQELTNHVHRSIIKAAQCPSQVWHFAFINYSVCPATNEETFKYALVFKSSSIDITIPLVRNTKITNKKTMNKEKKKLCLVLSNFLEAAITLPCDWPVLSEVSDIPVVEGRWEMFPEYLFSTHADKDEYKEEYHAYKY